MHRQALRRRGYHSESFDVMVTIADVLERDHGWDPSHADACLERMRLWEQELSARHSSADPGRLEPHRHRDHLGRDPSR